MFMSDLEKMSEQPVASIPVKPMPVNSIETPEHNKELSENEADFFEVKKELPQHRDSIIIKYFSKMKGKRCTVKLTLPPLFEILISGFGSFIGIAAVSILAFVYDLPFLIASFGASAVLIYGYHYAYFSQPRNVFFGHVLSAAVGVVSYALLGSTWWSCSLAAATALVIMILTRTTHPPGGATALLAVMSHAGPAFILMPVAAGAMILIIIALLINNLSPNRSYPVYWF